MTTRKLHWTNPEITSFGDLLVAFEEGVYREGFSRGIENHVSKDSPLLISQAELDRLNEIRKALNGYKAKEDKK